MTHFAAKSACNYTHGVPCYCHMPSTWSKLLFQRTPPHGSWHNLVGLTLPRQRLADEKQDCLTGMIGKNMECEFR